MLIKTKKQNKRIDVNIKFPLPDPSERTAIFKLYAKQLNKKELKFLVERTHGKSGRDIKVSYI